MTGNTFKVATMSSNIAASDSAQMSSPNTNVCKVVMITLKEIRLHDGLPIPHEYYRADSGEVMMRVWGTVQKDGASTKKLNGEWVLFDKNSRVLDFDTYSNDLAERNGCRFDDR
jgi:hypothetical protein